jgi:spore maturation protein CgeB
MLILYVAMKYDYGKPEQGHSYEHYNFYHSLLHMGYDILYFDFKSLAQKHGRDWMNRRLIQVARAEKPELMFTVLFSDELDPVGVRQISEDTTTVTLNWFCDDHWRFDSFSRYWAPCFNWVVTTAKSALPKYEKLGYKNVIKSQWACNHFLYRKLDLPRKYDVTFVGKPHGNRREVIEKLRSAGINIRVWGTGWESGRLSQEEMIRVFNQSRVNLNLSNSSTPLPADKPQTRRRVRNLVSTLLDTMPLGSPLKRAGRRLLRLVKDRMSGGKVEGTSGVPTPSYPDQIKGRNFEVPGCGGFLLTGWAENLSEYYRPGREIVCFDSTEDLIKKTIHYLVHEDERERISMAGYERTMREHTYVHRFAEIFERMGFQSPPIDSIMSGRIRPGATEEIC